MKLSDKILSMQFSPIRKFSESAAAAEENGKKIYQLNIGQPDIETPQVFWDTVNNCNLKILSYCESAGTKKLRSAICKYFARLGVSCTCNDIIVTNGASEALLFAYTALLDHGDEVLIPEPFYANYKTMIIQSDGVVVPIPTTAESGYHYANLELLESKVTSKTKVLCISNPGNPTGTLLTRDDMRLIADFVKKHDLWLIADEAYREFIYEEDGRLSTFAEFNDISDRTIIIDSISKRFSACGARIGFLMTKNAQLYENLMKLAQCRLSCPTLDQEGAAALYNLDPHYFDSTRATYKSRRDCLYNELLKIDGIVCQKPGGAFYMMAKLPIEDSEDFLTYLINEFDHNGESVMFAPGNGFYEDADKGKNEIRIAYILNETDLKRSIQLLRLGLESYKAKNTI